MTLCPICRKPVVEDDPNMPFCSDRCRLLDLANWADGKYVIPGEPEEDDGLSLPEGSEEDRG